MEKLKQTSIAKKANISDGFLSEILSGKKRPSWPVAKKLAAATKTQPALWLDGTPEQIKERINKGGK